MDCLFLIRRSRANEGILNRIGLVEKCEIESNEGFPLLVVPALQQKSTKVGQRKEMALE